MKDAGIAPSADTVEACLTLPDAAERQLCVALLDADVDKPE